MYVYCLIVEVFGNGMVRYYMVNPTRSSTWGPTNWVMEKRFLRRNDLVITAWGAKIQWSLRSQMGEMSNGEEIWRCYGSGTWSRGTGTRSRDPDLPLSLYTNHPQPLPGARFEGICVTPVDMLVGP